VGVPPTSPGDANVPSPASPYLNPQKEIRKHQSSHLPHWEQEAKLYFVTWRLGDSLPMEKLQQWGQQRDVWITQNPKPWDQATEQEYHEKFSKTLDHWLDAGSGECVLQDPAIARIVVDALLHFDGERYLLDAFVVMPNHVHVLFRLAPGLLLEDVIQSWKSFSAKKINQALGREGVLWQRDYWDRIVRDGDHRVNIGNYIVKNPVRAKLKEGRFILFSSVVGGTPTLLEGGTPTILDVGGTPTLLEGGTPTILDEGGTPTLLAGGTPAILDVGGTPTLLEGTPALLEAFCDPGISINSGSISGLPTAEAKAMMIAWLEANHLGKRRIQYKLRDWLFSRQRYWGEPFPIVWKDGKHQAIPESELPLLAPPLDDYKPSGTPEPILSKATQWITLPDGSIRETNTMPQWAGSCWYYLRYCDPRNTGRFISREADCYWSGVAGSSTDHRSLITDHSAPRATGMVDLYVGGTEHAVLHLLYARFWHKVLYDLGHVTTPEPFQKLVNQGLILGEDGQKMSKSRGNVVNPDDVVKEYGADSLRLYEMFMGPLEQVKPWQMKGVEGVSRFLARVWRVAFEEQDDGYHISPKIRDVGCADKALLRVVHETLKKVGEDIEKLSFNTAISQMMICTNAFTQAEVVPLDEFIRFLTVLNPFAPHLAEEVHERVAAAFKRPARLLSEASWPAYDPVALVRNEIELVVQVNGKLRDRLMISKDAGEEDAKAAALASPRIRELTDGKTIRKIVFVPGKLLNIVAS